MQINDSLKLVLPISGGAMAYHTPISRDIYEMHYSTINAAKAALSRKGLHYQMGQGPSIANLVLKDEGLRDAAERGNFDDRGEPVDTKTPALFGELKRLTVILAPGQAGYEILPVDAAISSGKIDVDDWSEIEAAIVFFTCHTIPAKKMAREQIGMATASVLCGSITSLPPMEYVNSLPTSTKTETTPKKASSLPV